MARARCTIVVPMLNEAESIALLGERLTSVLDVEDIDWEVLFVDDGSTDESFEEVKKLNAADGRFKCIRFSRNFGSHVAASAGLEHAVGDVAILMTADHEEPPESIPALLRMWREGYHVVWGIRANRAQTGFSRLASRAYHRLFRWLANMAPGQDEIGGGLFLTDRRVLDAVRRFSERNRNIIGLLLWAGFKQGRFVYQPAARKYGRSKWTLWKKIQLALDTFVGFSTRPLRLMLVAGIVTAALGVAALSVALVDLALNGRLSTSGIVAAGAALIGLCVGVPLASTGLIGEYIWRALDESRGRPLYVLMDRIGVGDESSRV